VRCNADSGKALAPRLRDLRRREGWGRIMKES
jgi:hypothetical protein